MLSSEFSKLSKNAFSLSIFGQVILIAGNFETFHRVFVPKIFKDSKKLTKVEDKNSSAFRQVPKNFEQHNLFCRKLRSL